MRPARRSGTLLTAAVTLVAVELIRASGPLLDARAGAGVSAAARAAVLVYAAPVLLGVVVLALRPRGATVAVVVGLVAARLVAQAQGTPTLAVVGTGAALGVAALVAALRHAARASGISAATGLVLGAALDIAVRSALVTLDPVWRDGVVAWLVTVAECLAVLGALWLARHRLPHDAQSFAGVARTGVVGPVLALWALVFASPAFLASQAGVGIQVACLLLLLGMSASTLILRHLPLRGGTGRLTLTRRLEGAGVGLPAALLLPVAVAGAYFVHKPWVIVPVLVGLVASAVLVARALAEPWRAAQSRFRAVLGYTVAGLLAGLGYVLPVLLFQVHYETPLPFDNRWVPVGAAVLVAALGVGPRPVADLLRRTQPRTLIPVALLLVPVLGYAVTPPTGAPTQHGDSLRLMSWNVKYGNGVHGQLDLPAIVDAVRAQHPDVLVLQEVNRGWPIGGATDMAEYLSQALRMDYAWSPAADGQFGNAILTRLPMSQVTAVRLPWVQPPQQRSYVGVTLRLESGRTLRLLGTHLQHRQENRPTRIAQINALLGAWNHRPDTIIAGDMNSWPTWPEPQLFRDAGFVSAQDVTGHGDQLTSPTPVATNRIDYIWGTPDLRFSDFAVLSDVVVSDHFPLVATVTLE
jgi:endonuclease/exonuclease/phosphatase family metal-dependent hydrolase